MTFIEKIKQIKNEMDKEISFKNAHTNGLENLVRAYLEYNNSYNLDINTMCEIARHHDDGKNFKVIRYFTSRPRPLTKNEKKVVDLHAFLSVIANLDLTPFELLVIFNHHKWYNELKELNLTKEKKNAICIIETLDVLEALLFKRSYKEGWGLTNVLEIMESEIGHFDPVIYEDVKNFIYSVADIKEIARPTKKITNPAVTI